MSKESHDVEGFVFSQIKEIALCEEVSLDDSLRNDHGIDSMDMIGIACLLEDEFEIEITSEDLDSFVTVRDVVTSVEKKISEK